MIHIVGESVIKEAQAFNDVRHALEFDCDVYLGAMWHNMIGMRLKDAVIYNMEPLYDESQLFPIAGYMQTLKENIVIDFSRKNVEYLKQKGIEAFHLPYGYHPYLERTHAGEKDIDVLFVGSEYYPRRKKLFEEINLHCNFVSARGVYGNELDKLISRAKVHLNVHHSQLGQTLETVRLNYLMANHGNIVSEFGNDPELNDAYAKGMRFAEYDELAYACFEALEHPFDGYETIRTMPHDCKSANDWVNSRR